MEAEYPEGMATVTSFDLFNLWLDGVPMTEVGYSTAREEQIRVEARMALAAAVFAMEALSAAGVLLSTEASEALQHADDPATAGELSGYAGGLARAESLLSHIRNALVRIAVR